MPDEFIQPPLDTDPEDVLQEVYDYLEANIPGWEPHDGNLEVWLAEAFAHLIAENRDVAADVPASIFRFFGSNIINLPPHDSQAAIAKTTWVMKDTAGYTIPAGTNVGIPASGDALIGFAVTSAVVVPAGVNTTGVGEVILQALVDGEQGNELAGPGKIIDALDFVTSITLTETTGGGADAETDEDYLDRLSLSLETITPRPITPRDFEILALASPGVERVTAIDLFNAANNLLTLNQSSAETDLTGFAQVTNVTHSRVTTQASHGSASVQMSSSAAGDMTEGTTGGTGGTAVEPGQQYRVSAEFRSAVSTRPVRVEVQWYDVGGVAIGGPVLGDTVADTTTGWTERAFNAISPSNAAFAAVRTTVLGTGAAAEVHYTDKRMLRKGNLAGWSPGGTVADNQEKNITVVPMGPDGLPLSSGDKATLDSTLQNLREIQFQVGVMDGVYSDVDVTTTLRRLPDFDPTQVDDAVTQAIKDALTPSNWPPNSTTKRWVNQPKVRHQDLSTIINNVPGVDYWETLTIGFAGGAQAAADLTLPGMVPLPRFGSINVTVVN